MFVAVTYRLWGSVRDHVANELVGNSGLCTRDCSTCGQCDYGQGEHWEVHAISLHLHLVEECLIQCTSIEKGEPRKRCIDGISSKLNCHVTYVIASNSLVAAGPSVEAAAHWLPRRWKKFCATVHEGVTIVTGEHAALLHHVPVTLIAEVFMTTMVAANETAFSQPHWRVIAQGRDTERWFNEAQVVGTGGILMPVPIRLPVGHYYYRFASSSSSREAQLGGGWWLDYENFSKVRSFAVENGYRLREAARLLLALPYAWTRVDLLVRALLVEPLRAWSGPGNPAHSPPGSADRGTKWIPVQHISVRQMYIPGLALKGSDGSPVYHSAFRQPVGIERSD